jgi:glutamate/tyrosine decarboxylase-like PLP-dependent enzyme
MTDPRPTSLDPATDAQWQALRTQGHRMLDDMLDHLQQLRTQPVWQVAPAEVRARFDAPLSATPTDLATLHQRFMADIRPYAVGNAHPRFMGWVQGGGTAVGMLAEMLAAGLNANVGGREQVPLLVERQVTGWLRDLFGWPASTGGLFVTGSSMANLIGLLVARTRTLGPAVRSAGLAATAPRLVAYTSAAAHGCIAQAMAMAGLGSDALHQVPTNTQQQIDVAALARQISDDRARGAQPFLIVGTAGTVDTGAIDDLSALADLAQREGLWLHVDGAFGALGMLAPEIAPRLAGIDRADSLALDFHKWGQVPYDAGFILVRDQADQLATFSAPAAYLQRGERGMAAGSPWPCDLGPDLSRGFRALKTWFTLQAYGRDHLGRMIAHTCALARHLAARVADSAELELLAPVALNIVCYRLRAPAAISDALNADVVADLQESGIAAPSTTRLNGVLAMRTAIVNHRTTVDDIDALFDATLRLGRARLQALPATPTPDPDRNPAPAAPPC